MLESDVRQEFDKRWASWIDRYEPRKGSSTGAPDTQLLVKGILRPVEFKVGMIVGGRIMPYEVRPAQVSWHTRLAAAGGKSFFIVGVMQTDVLVFFMAEALKLLSARHSGMLLDMHCGHIKTGFKAKWGGDAIFCENICQFILNN